MKKTISVIMPVYNVATYLPECIDSVLSQSYGDLEIILIDDGSTDHSGEICDTYAAKDSRIRVIHQQNGGAAAAKNAGLRVATGYYLAFLDSDDYLEPNAYAFMVSALEERQADVVQCAFRNVYVDATVDRYTMNEEKEYTVTEYLQRFTVDWMCSILWDKLYKRRLFDGIFFEEGHKIDDEYFTYQGIMNADKIIYVPRIVYNYRKRQSGVMLSPTSAEQIVLDQLDFVEKRRQNVIGRFPHLKECFDDHYINCMLALARDYRTTANILTVIRRQIASLFKEDPVPKMALVNRFRLKNIQYASIKALLQRKNMPPDMCLPGQCFE